MAQLFEDRPVAAIEAYFERHGLALRVHTSPPKPPSRGEERRLPCLVGRSIEIDTSTHWAALGRLRHYGKGHSPDEAIRSAARRYRVEQAPEGLATTATLYCPRCGDIMDDSGPTQTCHRGEMPLSEMMDRELPAAFTDGGWPPPAKPLTGPWGGTWYCPHCGVEEVEADGLVSCPECGRQLNKYLYPLLEFNPHRRDDGRWG